MSHLARRIPLTAALSLAVVGCNEGPGEARSALGGVDTRDAADAGSDAAVLTDVAIDTPTPLPDTVVRPDTGQPDASEEVGPDTVPPPPDVTPPPDVDPPGELPDAIVDAIERFCEAAVPCGLVGPRECYAAMADQANDFLTQVPEPDAPECGEAFAEVLDCYTGELADDCDPNQYEYPCMDVQYALPYACGFYGYDG